MLGAVVLGYFAYEIPDILKRADLKRHPAIIMEARDGTVFARHGNFYGDAIAVRDVPPYLVHAFLAIEDRRFYDHSGVDIWGIARAALSNVWHGHVVQGGSTITQQLAKNLFLGPQRTLRRKVQEVLLAIWLENQLTKDEILSAYLNRVYLGSGAYGVDAASRLYFGKTAREVNLREAAILAALPRAPSRYSPLNDPQAAEARSRVVLQAMVDAGYLAASQKADAVTLTTLPSRKPATGGAEGRYYADWIMDQLGDLVSDQDEDVIIRTTLDLPMEREAETKLRSILEKEGPAKQVSQAALVTIGHEGAVRALVGGNGYYSAPFNRVTQAKRQPGSAFKPFVYIAALENGIDENETLLDAPLKIGSWSPENYTHDYRGEVPMQDALAYSLNTATVRLAMQTGIGNVREIAQKMGITSPLKRELGLALGASEVSLIDITSAYAVLAQDGYAVIPYGIEQIRTKKGNVIYQREAPGMPRLLASSTVAALGKMLHAVTNYGTGRRAAVGIDAAGKTGTTQDYRDAWFIGYSGKLTTGVWMGNDDNSVMKDITGGSLPAQLWHDYMVAVIDGANESAEHTEGHGDEEGRSYTRSQSRGFMKFLDSLFDGSVSAKPEYPGPKH